MGVKLRLFGHISDPTFVSDRIELDAFSFKEYFPRCHANEACDHLHSGGFSRTVCSQVAGNLTGARGEADVFDGRNARIAFMNMAKFKHRVYTYVANYISSRLLTSKPRRTRLNWLLPL